MFVGDAWYAAAWSDEIGKGPLARRICNQPIVLYRDAGGDPVALYDSCCHRGAPLSVGTVVEEGMQCAYHGLVFGSDGRCVKIPGQDAIPSKARVRSYPLTEKDQMVWIWMGEPEKADKSKVIDYPFHDDPKWPHRHGVLPTSSRYEILMDNLMDLTHLAHVHASTVGGAAPAHFDAKTDVQPSPRGVFVKRWMPDCPPPPTYLKSLDLPDRVERWQEFEFVAPSSVLQWNGAVPVGQGAQDPMKRTGGFSHRLFHSVTPETATSCHYFWSVCHSHRANDPAATEALASEIQHALREDKWIVEVQQERVLETGDEWLVDIRSDIPRVAMRRALASMLEKSGPVVAGPV